MILKFNTNLLKVNIFIVLIFNIYLVGLVYGPSLVNLFIFSLLVIFLINLKQNDLYSIRKYNLTTNLQIIFCIYLILNSYFVGDSFLFNNLVKNNLNISIPGIIKNMKIFSISIKLPAINCLLYI